MITIYFLLSYVFIFFLNRWINIKIQEIDNCNVGNPAGVMFCFFYLFGTFLLILIFFKEKLEKNDYDWFKPKKDRKN